MYVNYSTSSGLKNASAQVSSYTGALMGFDVMCPSTGYNVFTVYDSADSNLSGKRVLAIIEGDAGMVGINHEFFAPVGVNNGIYVDVTGTGTDYQYIVRFTL